MAKIKMRTFTDVEVKVSELSKNSKFSDYEAKVGTDSVIVRLVPTKYGALVLVGNKYALSKYGWLQTRKDGSHYVSRFGHNMFQIAKEETKTSPALFTQVMKAPTAEGKIYKAQEFEVSNGPSGDAEAIVEEVMNFVYGDKFTQSNTTKTTSKGKKLSQKNK